MSSNANLSEKDKEFRDFTLTGNMWKVILSIGAPLALYQCLGQLFKILDSMMASHISASSVSTVSYLSQINSMLAALGGGLAIGSSLKISEAYGAGDFELVKKRVNTLFALCAILGFSLLAILIPTAPTFLRMANTPKEFITEGSWYFILDLTGMVISFFNHVYIAIERARGNSKRIFYLNLWVLVSKLLLTALFVYVLDCGINMIAVCTILSQSFLLAAAMINLRQKDNAFGISLRTVTFKKRIIAPMVGLSIPVIGEKLAFSMGKVVINSMSTIYNPLTVGALGLSNTIGGITTSPQNGFQEGASAVISQNLGDGNPKRALEAFRCSLIINIGIGIALTGISLAFLSSISNMFAANDPEFGQMISSIYRIEAYGAVPLGINAAVMALLYGFGKTKTTMMINFSRVFIFRIPVLWFLQHFTDLGSISVGIVMAVSNVSVGVVAILIAVYEVRAICRKNGISFFPSRSSTSA